MQGDARCGTHAVPRVTSVNPGACKYNRRDEPQRGSFSIRTRTSEREGSTTSARYADSSLKPLSLCLSEETMYTHAPNYESMSILGNPENAFLNQNPCDGLEWKHPVVVWEMLS